MIDFIPVREDTNRGTKPEMINWNVLIRKEPTTLVASTVLISNFWEEDVIPIIEWY